MNRRLVALGAGLLAGFVSIAVVGTPDYSYSRGERDLLIALTVVVPALAAALVVLGLIPKKRPPESGN